MAQYLFFLLSAICIGSILGMIVSKNQAYSALYLVVCFACTAGFFAMLDAPFIAAVQIIIYAGAIMVLFIFVIMMIDVRRGLSPERKKWTIIFASGIAGVLVIELLFALRAAFSQLGEATPGELGNPSELGELLFTKYLYPFEITSILIIAALVGSIVLVKKRDEA